MFQNQNFESFNLKVLNALNLHQFSSPSVPDRMDRARLVRLGAAVARIDRAAGRGQPLHATLGLRRQQELDDFPAAPGVENGGRAQSFLKASGCIKAHDLT